MEKRAGPIASPITYGIHDSLPQPVADDTITNELSRIRDNIKNYARTYHHSTPVAATSVNEVSIRGVVTATGLHSSALVGALCDPTTRQDALRLVISWIVLSKCSDEHDMDLLPTGLAELVATVPARDDANAGKWEQPSVDFVD